MEIAVSSLAEDREMASLYAAAGVQEYWIVNAAAKAVEVYRRPLGDQYGQTLKIGNVDTLRCESLPGVVITLAGLFG